jgi:hypothetical protein
MIAAVQKETGLLLFLFSLISRSPSSCARDLWSMIAEDQGHRHHARQRRPPGVAGVWVGYGLAIGVVGAILAVPSLHRTTSTYPQ